MIHGGVKRSCSLKCHIKHFWFALVTVVMLAVYKERGWDGAARGGGFEFLFQIIFPALTMLLTFFVF